MTNLLTNLLITINLACTHGSLEKSLLSGLTELWSFDSIIISTSWELVSVIWLWGHLASETCLILESWISLLHELRTFRFNPLTLFRLRQIDHSFFHPWLYVVNVLSFVPVTIENLPKVVFVYVDIVIDTNLRVRVGLWSTHRSWVSSRLECLSRARGCTKVGQVGLFSRKSFLDKFLSFQWTFLELFPSFLDVAQKRVNITSFKVQILLLRDFNFLFLNFRDIFVLSFAYVFRISFLNELIDLWLAFVFKSWGGFLSDVFIVNVIKKLFFIRLLRIDCRLLGSDILCLT